jgi:beta-lactamase class A
LQANDLLQKWSSMKRLSVLMIGLWVASLCIAKGEKGADEFANLEKRSGARVGIAALDVSTNKSVEYHEQERFLTCSTFKVLAVAAVLKRVDEKEGEA